VRVSVLTAAVCSFVLAASATASAQASDDDGVASGQGGRPEDPEAARSARVHFRKGLEHFEERAYRQAIREFELAAQAVPSADLWYNIARAHEELSEYERAIEHYQRYLRDRVDPPDRAEVESHIEELERRAEAQRKAQRTRPDSGTLRVQSTVEGARVTVGGRSIGETPVPVPLSLEPGRHRVVVEKEGYVPFRSEVQVEPGVTTGAYADLEPAVRYRSVGRGRVWTWVATGLAAGALGTSLGLGIRAKRLQNDGNLDDARDWSTYSDYALGAGLGLALVSAVLWFVEGRSVASERVVGPQPTQR
jgi:tetratricopeptide (TPR) repeat protein